jgi:hypothetical protein
MAEDHPAASLRELRRIRIALYLIVLMLCMIACVLALHSWAESTRPPRTAAGEVRPGLWAERALDVGRIHGPREAHPRGTRVASAASPAAVRPHLPRNRLAAGRRTPGQAEFG